MLSASLYKTFLSLSHKTFPSFICCVGFLLTPFPNSRFVFVCFVCLCVAVFVVVVVGVVVVLNQT